jgi:ADP-ribosylglycohydrolase/protein-tyrosine phosphatase
MFTSSLPPVKTSNTDPLRIDVVPAPGGGLIGVTLCPGKRQPHGATGHWQRELETDLARIHDWGAVAVVTLMTDAELARYGVPTLGRAVEHLGLEWHHLPIDDTEVPDAGFERRWIYSGLRLRRHLRAGNRVLLHCLGGLGRSGTVAARLLVELGAEPDAAMSAVRVARAGAIENQAQEAHIAATRAVDPRQDATTDRLFGALLGGAIGDAFGYPIEFYPLADIRRRFGPEGLRKPVLHDGKLLVSDDTQMTLFTLEGMQRAVGPGGVWQADRVVEEVRRAYLDWYDTQEGSRPERPIVGALARSPALRVRRAPGNTCLSALYAGGTGSLAEPINDSKGSGGAMRSAPLGFLPGIDAADAFVLGARTAALTHGHPDGWASAGFVAATVRRTVAGQGLADALAAATGDLAAATSPGERPTTEPYAHALRLAREQADAHAAIAALGGGWTGDEAVAIAAYAALTATDFMDLAARAANHDGDSDSTASIAGQIWGAEHGMCAVPHAWAHRLDVFEAIVDLIGAWRRVA